MVRGNFIWKVGSNRRVAQMLMILPLAGLFWLLAEDVVVAAFSLTPLLARGGCARSSISSSSSSSRYLTRKDLHRLGTTTFFHRRTTTQQQQQRHRRTNRNSVSSASLAMRDRSSSYWFSVGDRVEVVEDVVRGGGPGRTTTPPQNLKGRTGTVVETWEKCDVDPTCCCAEQVELDMAVKVAFGGGGGGGGEETNNETASKASATTPKNRNRTAVATDDDDSTTFYYHFAEDELMKL